MTQNNRSVQESESFPRVPSGVVRKRQLMR